MKRQLDEQALMAMLSVLSDIANGNEQWPAFRCQEESSGAICNRPATTVNYVPDGHVVTCDKCAKMYHMGQRSLFTAPWVMIGNLRDMARNAIEEATGEC